MNFPENLKYSKDHEWIRVEGDIAYIGITAFAQGELGDIVFVDVDTEGETLDKDEVFGTIEAVKTVADLYAPISGEIIEINTNLEDNPEFINKTPYTDGWIVTIKIDEPIKPSEHLDASQYKVFIGK